VSAAPRSALWGASGLSSASSTTSILYEPSSQRPKSTMRQRAEQNGRVSG
jgi:hypothetical protein